MSRRNWRGARPCPDWKRRPRESGTHKGSFMDIRAPEQQYNPYRIFSREQWARLRDDTPMTLEPGEFERLRSLHDRLDIHEVEDIFLPLSRLLSIYVDATLRLYQAQRQFLGIRDRKVPYVIVPNKWLEVDRPDILIVEGVNVLQTGRLPRDGKAVPVVSDFFDFSVYIDADESVLREWYVRRFLALRDTAFHDPRSYFHRYAPLSDEEATATALAIWERTNLANLEENILPTRPRATLILKKGADHVVETVALRRL